MRQPALGLIIALAGAASACDPGGPNGKRGVLFLNAATSPVGAGLESSVSIPHHTAIGGGPNSPQKTETYDFDFAGTTLETSGTNGLTPLAATLDADGDWVVDYRCGSTTGELSVRVMAGTDARYEDAVDLDCRAGTLSLLHGPSPLGGGAAATRTLPASQFLEIEVALTDAGGTPLHGGTIGFSDAASPLQVHEGMVDDPSGLKYVRVVAPGSDPVLRAGDASVVVPIAVPGPSEWTLAVDAAPAAGSTTAIAWVARALDPQQVEIPGLYGCSYYYELTTGTGGAASTEGPCSGTVEVGGQDGTLQVWALGNTASVSVAF